MRMLLCYVIVHCLSCYVFVQKYLLLLSFWVVVHEGEDSMVPRNVGIRLHIGATSYLRRKKHKQNFGSYTVHYGIGRELPTKCTELYNCFTSCDDSYMFRQ
jgi:hypothetical protein